MSGFWQGVVVGAIFGCLSTLGALFIGHFIATGNGLFDDNTPDKLRVGYDPEIEDLPRDDQKTA